ncbi:NAD(P)(+)--arginine ADP-ribosyltransferase 2-like [Ctenopharyngodon idella]|uniref:NAD(P)(+)--arginine ADP-ribosyltransferase 2-like n=1 Tax=Ctenopharyngodon idella TaxID=7959 RepID=UPI00222FF5FC|nr:NAD(P)(+)--arginine ADP-ribosyltransferase 2-like [Ctenopharyngodon idella]XP_051769511.1 NAD(P)(+)--arginine ADP-ribosyltransferase 2-like [Ctenopharyngodon idella]
MLLIIEALLFLAALRQDHRAAVEETIYPLDKAINSVDDQYYGCGENMADLVKNKYLDKELRNSPNFSDAWKEAENVISRWNIFSNLKKKHKIAIHVYTDDKVYSEFNHDTRNGKQNFKDMKYKWYSLHFLLTEAIQILKKKQNRCFDTFRGTNIDFHGRVFKEVRFGSFASSSLNRDKAERFGTVSCFAIHTCEGANVTKYSQYSVEEEVLIPPYEKFNVTAVKTRTDEPDLWCETVYILKSSGIRSDLNCALFNEPTKTITIH